MNADPLSPDTAFDRTAAPFLLRGAQKTVLTLRLSAPEDPHFMEALLSKIAHSPEFFRDAPIVFDVGPIQNQPPIDLAELRAKLEAHRLRPVGLQNGGEAWNEAAREAGLALFANGGSEASETQAADSRSIQGARKKGRSEHASKRGAGMIVREPVRGGQQIYSPDGDLVILAQVGHGAEVVAAGNIHIYAPLRGRAFAGVDGDRDAMIFCDKLEAELVSVAGLHVVNEEIDRALVGRRVAVRSDGSELRLIAMS